MRTGTILLTGASGFLGSVIYNYLKSNSFNIITLGRSKDNNIICDLSKKKPVLKDKDIDFIIHCAGKAHTIPTSQQQIDEFYEVNSQGTKNLIKSISNLKVKNFILISTVAVYGLESGDLINEKTLLNGSTPYASSKIQAEKSVIDFGIANNIKTLILRLPLVTGENPPGNLGAIIKAIQKGYYFRIGKGEAKKSIIAASDIAMMIPELFNLNGVYNLTDIKNPMMCEIDSIIAKKFNNKIKSIPVNLIKVVAKIGDLFYFLPFNSSKFEKLTKNLTFSNKKLFNDIKYRPSRGLADIVKNLNN